MKKHEKRLLAVASSGGHWIQLLRMTPAFDGYRVRFVSTFDESPLDEADDYKSVRDGSMWEKKNLVIQLIQITIVVLRFRPHVIVTTGAAPGFFAIVVGRLIRCNTIWVDSLANSEELSLAGQKARMWARHWLTQWPHLEKEGGPGYIGSVL